MKVLGFGRIEVQGLGVSGVGGVGISSKNAIDKSTLGPKPYTPKP